MSLGVSPLIRKPAGLAIPTPVYADTNDSPIDLRKKVAIRRSKYGYDHVPHQYNSDFSSSDEDDVNDHHRVQSSNIPLSVENGLWTKRLLLDRASYHHSHHQPAFPSVPNPYQVLSLRNLHPVLSEQYGIQYALFASPEGTHVVPVPTNYSSSAHLPHLRAQLAMPDTIKRNYYSPEQRHDRDEDVEEVKQDLYYRQQHAKPQKQNEDDNFRIRDSPVEKYYPWRKSHYLSAFKNLENAPFSAAERLRESQKEQSSKNNLEDAKKGYYSNGHDNSSSPQEHQPLQTLKGAERPAFSFRRRARSLSLSHVKEKFAKYTKKNLIHSGYSSDSELFRRSKPSSSSLLKSNGQLPPMIHKKRKLISRSPIDGSESDLDNASRHSKPERTLLNLLSSNPATNHKSDSDVLLRQLQRSPVNNNINKEGYPWSVYEYYNHLVEKFRDRSYQRSPTHLRSYGENCSPPVPPSPMLVSGIPLDEDNIACQQRKRPTRALTGKHVKHGTGASPSTLITLRQKIQERQRAKELRTMGIDQHHQEPTIKIARNGNCKKPKQATNVKRLKQDQNGGTPPIRDLRT